VSTGISVRRREVFARLSAGTTGNLLRAVVSNRKALAGLTLLVIFFFLAAFPGLLAHDNPAAEIYSKSAPPSAAPTRSSPPRPAASRRPCSGSSGSPTATPASVPG